MTIPIRDRLKVAGIWVSRVEVANASIAHPEVLGCAPVGEIMGKKLEVCSRPLPKNDPVRRRPDTTRAKHRLGWESRVLLLDGLRKTVDYFRTVCG